MARTTENIVCIGASTGGTQALRWCSRRCRPVCPGIVIVQHMPEKFTEAFARRSNGLCAMEVKEAADGDTVLRGRALIAPGDKHMVLQRSGARYYVASQRRPAGVPPPALGRRAVPLRRPVRRRQRAGHHHDRHGRRRRRGSGRNEATRAPRPSPRMKPPAWCSACPRRRSRAAPRIRSCRWTCWRERSCGPVNDEFVARQSAERSCADAPPDLGCAALGGSFDTAPAETLVSLMQGDIHCSADPKVLGHGS